jgi:hypothetical protein
MAPSAGKAKRRQKRAQKIAASVDEFMEDLEKLPPEERQEIVDLFVQLFLREKHR